MDEPRDGLIGQLGTMAVRCGSLIVPGDRLFARRARLVVPRDRLIVPSDRLIALRVPLTAEMTVRHR